MSDLIVCAHLMPIITLMAIELPASPGLVFSFCPCLSFPSLLKNRLLQEVLHEYIMCVRDSGHLASPRLYSQLLVAQEVQEGVGLDETPVPKLYSCPNLPACSALGVCPFLLLPLSSSQKSCPKVKAVAITPVPEITVIWFTESIPLPLVGPFLNWFGKSEPYLVSTFPGNRVSEAHIISPPLQAGCPSRSLASTRSLTCSLPRSHSGLLMGPVHPCSALREH